VCQRIDCPRELDVGLASSELMQVAIPTAMDEIENAEGGPGRMSASKNA
jgi:hypothetical protein